MLFGILKINVEYLSKIDTKKNLVSKLKNQSLLKIKLDDLLKGSFEMPLKTS